MVLQGIAIYFTVYFYKSYLTTTKAIGCDKAIKINIDMNKILHEFEWIILAHFHMNYFITMLMRYLSL